MAIDTDMFDADMQVAEVDLPQAFTFGGQSWVAIADPQVERTTMMATGYDPDINLRLHVRVSQFTDAAVTPPEEEATITVGSVTYRIASITKDPDGIAHTWDLVKKHV